MEQTRMAFALRGEGTETLEIDVFDIIGRSFWDEGTTAKGMRSRLQAAKNATQINLTVNSRGGDAWEGVAIYNLLAEHPARVVAHVPGLAASAATVILMAADEINISEGAMLMIHNAWGAVMGKPDQMRNHADMLDRLSGQMADIYAARTGQPKDSVASMMAKETWMTAAEAKSNKFADIVKPAKKGASVKALACLDLSGFAQVPDYFMAAVAQARSDIQPDDGAQRAEENESMTEEQFLKALGCKSMAEAQALVGKGRRFEKIEASAKATDDEAQGVVLAALNSHAELPKAQARIAELEQTSASNTLDSLIAKAKDEKKVTPAIEKSVRDAFAAKEVTLKGIESWLANLAPVAALAAAPKIEAPPTVVTADQKHNGKTYAEMLPKERADLKRENPELFAAMRSASN